MNETAKKLHHFVPRFYLRAWATKEKIWCLQDGKILNPNIRNVGAENYFYGLQELSPEDVNFLREAIIKDSPGGLKPVHEQLLQAFSVPFEAKRRLQKSGRATPEQLAVIDRMIVELNENLHTGIEDDFRPYLEAMILGNLAFLDEPAHAAVFYRALAVQYARTNHIRKSRLVMDQARRDLYLRVANPLVHMLGINVGQSLFVEREQHRVVLLDNTTDVPFVTADQPVINIAASPLDTAPPEKFELYYPLSPTRAMLLMEPGDAPPSEPSASEVFIRLQNLRMAAHSYRQVFSSTPQVLESIIQELPAYMSCWPVPTQASAEQYASGASRSPIH